MSAERIDTLIEARWIAPVEPAGVIFEEHALAVRDGKIVDLLPSADAQLRYQATERVELSDHLLIPGLVNAHTHAAMTLMRGLADDLPLMPWLTQHVWPVEGALMSAEFVRDGTELAAAEMLRGGITSCQDMYFFPDVAAAAFEQMGMRAVVGLIVIEFPSAWAGTSTKNSAGFSVSRSMPYSRKEPLLTRTKAKASSTPVSSVMIALSSRASAGVAPQGPIAGPLITGGPTLRIRSSRSRGITLYWP